LLEKTIEMQMNTCSWDDTLTKVHQASLADVCSGLVAPICVAQASSAPVFHMALI